MYRRIVSVSAFLTFLFIAVSFPAYAVESKYGSVKETNQGVSYEADDNGAKTNQQTEVQNYPGFLYKPLTKDAKPQKAGFIRLKPRLMKNGETKGQMVYDIEFTDSEMTEKKVDNGPDDKPYVAIEKIEPIDKSSFMKKEAGKEHKAEVSLGYKLSPFSEICLGKGILVERNDSSTPLTRDDGWRIKFKTSF